MGAGAAGQVNVELDWTSYTNRPFDELRDELIPRYLAELPATDAWGQLYEFGATTTMESTMPIGIRSRAADGEFDDDSYSAGPFIATDYDQDIVWAGGFFVRWPSGLGIGHPLTSSEGSTEEPLVIWRGGRILTV